jgi:hypothetical protein
MLPLSLRSRNVLWRAGVEMDGGDEQAKRYRERAQELLTLAADMKDLKSKETLLEVAMDYLQMAAAREALSKSDRERIDRSSKFKPR